MLYVLKKFNPLKALAIEKTSCLGGEIKGYRFLLGLGGIEILSVWQVSVVISSFRDLWLSNPQE